MKAEGLEVNKKYKIENHQGKVNYRTRNRKREMWERENQYTTGRQFKINIINETKKRLEYQKAKMDDLSDLDVSKLSYDAKTHIRKETDKAIRNLEYYEEILKIIEGRA